MPLYEYKCASCGDVFEVLQKFSDEPVSSHENCGGAVERLISRSAFQLKGSGWYATDYAKGTAKADADSAKKDDGKVETKGEPAKADSASSTAASPNSSESSSTKGPSSSGGDSSSTAPSTPAPAAAPKTSSDTK